MTSTPSPHQEAIYTWQRSSQGSLIIEAVAGSGKTTTLVELARRMPSGDLVRFFAFNKGIADVLKGKLLGARNVTVSTFHSAGWQAILKHLNAKLSADKGKMRDLQKTALGQTDRYQYGDQFMKLVGLGKGHLLKPHVDLDAWQGLIDHHDLDFDYLIPPGRHTDAERRKLLADEQIRVCMLADDLLDASNQAAAEPFAWKIDFDDQLYLPLLWDLPFPQYDWVLVDELQDTNLVQRAFLHRSLKPGGRLIGVGDRHQAIYGWRGAAHDAMDLVKADFRADELPLSVCYRCPTLVVRKAQTIVPHIEAAPLASLGSVIEGKDPKFLSALTPQDVILCRNNAPLVAQAYALIAQGVGCQILGKDIGEGLKKLVWKFRAETVEELEVRLEEYRLRETKRYRERKQEDKAQGIEDRVSCLSTIIDGLDTEERTVDGVIEGIDGLFGDGSRPVLTLATIHKAKGREWPTVVLMREDLLPSYWATQGWQVQQEENLRYVAYTRATHALWILDDKPEWLKKKQVKEAGVVAGPYSRETGWEER